MVSFSPITLHVFDAFIQRDIPTGAMYHMQGHLNMLTAGADCRITAPPIRTLLFLSAQCSKKANEKLIYLFIHLETLQWFSSFHTDHTRCLKRPSPHPASHVWAADEENRFLFPGGAEEVSRQIVFFIDFSFNMMLRGKGHTSQSDTTSLLCVVPLCYYQIWRRRDKNRWNNPDAGSEVAAWQAASLRGEEHQGCGHWHDCGVMRGELLMCPQKA